MKETVFTTKEGEAPALAILVGLITRDRNEAECEISLGELERLLDTAGGSVYARMVQARETPDARTCIGSGKIEELRELCVSGDIKLVVFDCDLSPAQIKNIENAVSAEGGVRVIDRSMLILDIFALHAVTAEGKLQVELAQLQYTIPRLSGHGTEMSRLGGGIGTRGPGESQLERDRRHVRRRIAALEAELSELARVRQTQRKQRDRAGLPKIAVAGYTNAGKSTLLNALTGAGILAEDKLFATLDPTTRKFAMPDGTEVLFTDTVGFIRNLPHHLVKAFRSTLEEVVYADIILLVMDSADNECAAQLEVTQKLISELGAAEKPILYVFNQIDRRTPFSLPLPYTDRERTVSISAKTGEGLDGLLSALDTIIKDGTKELTFFFAHHEGAALTQLYRYATVLDADYRDDGTYVKAVADKRAQGMFASHVAVGGEK